MKNFTAASFSPGMLSLRSSWRYVKADFASEFAELESRGELSAASTGEKIWETRTKYVFKIALPGGGAAVFKSFHKIVHPAKFMLRPSPGGFEARNYALLEKLGLPLPELLAAGDTRKNFKLSNTFVLTRFAEGFCSCDEFAPGGSCAGRNDLKQDVLGKSMELLARCHDAGILHRGYTGANVLWKETAEKGKGELLLIDLASCRNRPRFIINLSVHKELKLFFKNLALAPAEKEELISRYCSARKKGAPSCCRLLKKLLD